MGLKQIAKKGLKYLALFGFGTTLACSEPPEREEITSDSFDIFPFPITNLALDRIWRKEGIEVGGYDLQINGSWLSGRPGGTFRFYDEDLDGNVDVIAYTPITRQGKGEDAGSDLRFFFWPLQKSGEAGGCYWFAKWIAEGRQQKVFDMKEDNLAGLPAGKYIWYDVKAIGVREMPRKMRDLASRVMFNFKNGLVEYDATQPQKELVYLLYQGLYEDYED